MVQVKNVLRIREQFFRHICNPRRPITENHRFLIAAVTVLNRAPVEMPAKLARGSNIGNILSFFYLMLALPFFVLPIINVIRGIDDSKLILPPCRALLIFVPCIQRGTVRFDIKDPFLVIFKIQHSAFLLLEQTIRLPAVLLEYHPAYAIRHMSNRIIIDFHAISIPNDILGSLV